MLLNIMFMLKIRMKRRMLFSYLMMDLMLMLFFMFLSKLVMFLFFMKLFLLFFMLLDLPVMDKLMNLF